MSLPAFIFNQLQTELHAIELQLLEKVSKTYDIPLEELKEECLTPLTVIPEAKDKIFISKKYKGRKIPINEDRCQALICNRGKGGQCTRPRCEGEDCCKQHMCHLKFGKVDNQIMEKQFNKPIRAIYK